MDDYGYFRHSEILINISGISDKEPIQVTFLQGKEALSSLYTFRLGVQTKNNILAADKVFGKLVLLTLTAKTEKKQYKNYKTGYISAIEMLKRPQWNAEMFQYYYEIELVPKFAFLQYHQDCRVFKNKNCTEIITAIFEEHGFSASNDYALNTTNSLAKTPFPVCVQYQESDFQFIQRLMAFCGMFYFFKHSDSKQQLMIMDNNRSLDKCDMEAPPYLINGQNPETDLMAGFYNLFFQSTLPEINIGCNSYDAMDPTKYLFAKSEASGSTISKNYLSSHKQFGTFISDTQLNTSALNQQQATVLFNERKTLAKKIRSECTLLTVSVGHTFETKNTNFKTYLGADCADKYVISEINYNIRLNSNQQKHNQIHLFYFDISAFPAAEPVPPLSPAAVPPSPVIGVIHHAFVVDKEGGTQADDTNAVADEFGMPYIGLHWDQTVRNQANPKKFTALNTIFPRPAGFFDVPHPGETVKAQFSDWHSLPYVLGSTGDNKNYKFPVQDVKTQSKIMSRPPTNDLKNVNQILFEDKQKNQNLFLDLPCQFNINAAKESDSPKFILSVDKKGNLSIEAASVVIKTTKGDISFNSAANIVLEAAKAITINAGSSMSIKAKTSLEQQAGTSMNIQAKTSMDQQAGTTMSIKANATMNVKAAATATVDGGGMLTLKGGLIKEN